MAKYSNTIEYNISTKLDSKGLTQLQQQLKQIEISIQKMDNAGSLNNKFADARAQIKGLGNALSEAFNPSLGMVDLAKFNTALKENGVSATQLRSAFQLAGADGQIAFNNLVGQLGQLDLGLKRSSSSLNKIATTFGNTFRWGVIASFFSQFMNAIHSSVDYVKELDDSLTQIMLVTDYNRDSMNAYAKAANEAAKAVGQTTVGMTNASLIFAQQGYDLTQSQELATLSAKLANASQQDTATTSDQITAYMNAYGLSSSIEDLSSALDSWALVANVSAADVAELATASQKAASTANSVGVNMDQLNAQIATIESVTRDAPEQIGNGLKTLYARFSDIKLGKTLEDGVNLGQVTGQLNKLGVQVLDQFGNIRDVGDILEDLMVIWDDLDQTTKEASAQTLAGKFQMNRFLALMDNSDMYREYLSASENAEGTLDQMNEEYLDSLEGRTAKIQASLEGIFSSIFDTDVVYPFIDAMQKFLDILQTLIDSLGGGSTIVLGLVSAFTQLFSNQIAQGINDFNINQAISKQRQENYQNSAATLDRLGAINPNPSDENSQAILNYARKINEMQPYLSQEQAQQSNEILAEMIKNTNDLTLAQEKLETQLNAVGATVATTFDNKWLAPFREDGVVNYTLVIDALKGLQGELEGSGQSISKMHELLDQFQKDLTESPVNINQVKESWALLEETLGQTSYGKEVSEFLKNLKTDADLTGEEFTKLTNKTKNLFEALGSFKNGDLTVDQLIKKLEEIDKLNSNVELKKVTTQGSIGVAEVSSEGMDSQQQIKQIVDTVGALGQLAFAIQSVQNLGSIWKNEDLTIGEKVLQTIINLSMVIPSLVNATNGLNEVFSLTKMAKIAAATEIVTAAKKHEEEVTLELVAAENALRIAQEHGKDEKAAELITRITELRKKLKIATDESAAAEIGLTTAENAQGIGATFAAGATELLNKALIKLKGITPEIWAITGVLAAVGILLGTIIAKVNQIRQDAEDAYQESISNLEKIKDLQQSINDFNDKYASFKETGEGGKDLVETAENLALALKEAGAEEEAQQIHLAALRAEAAGTEASYEALSNTINEANQTASNNAYLDTINASAKILQLEGRTLEEVISKEQELKQAQEDLANLDPFAPNYEAQRKELENLIATLKNTIDQTQEAVEAAHALMDAQGELAGNTLANIDGMNLGVVGDKDFKERSATLDFFAMRDYFSATVDGFDLLSDLEQVDFILQHVDTDAEKAAAKIQQLLLANENLSYGWDDAAGGIEKTDDYVEVTQSLERAGFNAEQSLQLIATLDENATMEEIQAKIQEVQANMDANGGDFSLALSTSLDTDQDGRELTQQLFSEMAPTDADVDADNFQQLGRYFAEIAENDPFDDIPDELAYSAEALADFTEAILRYDSAVEKAEKSMDHWREVLEDSDASSLDMAEVTDELANVYADLLDLPFDNLSRDFTSDINNLNDLEAAVNGDEEAYNRLMEAAQQDITAQFAVQVDGNEEAEAALADMNAALATLIDQDWTVNPDVDTTDFIDALNNLIDSGAVTAEQVQAYLGSMGMEATMESETETQETPVVATGVQAVQDAPIELNGTLPIGNADGSSFGNMGVTTTPYKASIPQFHYEAVETDATQVASMTGFALTTTSGNTTSGGHITSINKKSSPSGGTKAKHASRPSSTGGGRGGGSKGKGGKGSGSKGGKANTIKPKEKKEHEKDYYEEVNSQLDKTEKVLSRIEKEEDRLVGDKARANQNKQLALLQKEIKLNEEKLKINKQELKDTDEKLKQQDRLAEQILQQQGIQMVIPNPVFDEDGVIANYEQISKALDDAHNELVKKYNAAAEAGNQELTEQLQEQMDSFDKYSKNLLDSAKRHDALQSEIEETTNALEELKDAIEDIQIAAYKAGIEAAKNFQDVVEQGAQIEGFFRDFDSDSFVNSFSIDERPYEHLIEDLTELETLYNQNEEAANQFYDTMIAKKKEDLKNASSKEERQAIQASIDYFQKERDRGAKNQLDYWSGRLEELQEWMNNPKAEGNPFGDNTAELQKVFEDVTQAALDSAENFRKKLQDVRDDLLDIYDEFDDRLDRQFKKYDDLVDKVEQMADVYSLYYGEDSYTELVDILQREGEILQSELTERTRVYEAAQQEYQKVLATGDQKTIEAMEDRMRDAEKEMRDTAEQLAETWVKQFETSIKRSMQTMTQNVWGRTTGTLNDDGTVSNITLGLEDLQTKWELEKQYTEDYKDEVEKAYEIDKLRSKYIDLLNDAQGASLGTQNKIRQQMQEQLESLENQTTLSEYDVKLANAKLEVLQKQIALEDAQRNKNKMQLRRDTQGNYRYVYRADEGDVKQAEDELLDSSFDAYELTKNQTITNNDRMISSFLDFQEKASEISERYKDDEIARKAALQTLAEEYKKIWAAMGEDFGDVTNGMYEVLWWNINNLIGDSATASLDMMHTLYDENGNIKENTGIMWRDLATTIENDVVDNIYNSATKAITDINNSAKILEKNMVSSLNTIGVAADNLKTSLSEVTTKANALKAANDELFNAFTGDNAKIQTAIDRITEYSTALQKAQDDASNLAKQLKEANETIARLTAEQAAYRTQSNPSSGTRTTNSNNNPSYSNNDTGIVHNSLPSTSKTTTPKTVTPKTTTPKTIRRDTQWNHKTWDQRRQGATGGYTGEWSGSGNPEANDGKLIWIHQKELILNAKDTENILDAVNLMRDMVSIIQIDALGKTLKSNINNANKNFGDTIEQRVEINATFPNVTNSNEIEAALLGLSDKAYQYSYRTR